MTTSKKSSAKRTGNGLHKMDSCNMRAASQILCSSTAKLFKQWHFFSIIEDCFFIVPLTLKTSALPCRMQTTLNEDDPQSESRSRDNQKPKTNLTTQQQNLHLQWNHPRLAFRHDSDLHHLRRKSCTFEKLRYCRNSLRHGQHHATNHPTI